MLTGGEAWPLVLLFVVLGATGLADWFQDRYPDMDTEIAPFHQLFSQSRELAARAVSDGAHITVQTKKGNMAVRTVDGNKMHVSVDKSASARMKLDSSDLEISDVAGSAKLRTHNEDIIVENVAGQIPIRTHTAKSLSVIQILRMSRETFSTTQAKWL